MRARRVVQLVAGVVLALVGLPLLIGGLVLGWLHLFERDDDGWLNTSTERVTSSTRAITSEDVDLGGSPTDDDWLPFDGDLATVRLQVSGGNDALFIGIGPTDDVAAYLDGVAHDVVTDGLFRPGPIELQAVAGEQAPADPADQTFWVARGTDALLWDVHSGNWTVVLMRADGAAGVTADITAGVKLDWLLPVSIALTLVGLGLLGGGVLAAVTAATAESGLPPASTVSRVPGSYPLRLDGRLDEPLNRWRWLVKWFLAIPHVLVLFALWVAFAVATFAAFVAILVTGRYPPRLFDFNVGVLRWTWRVGFYAFSPFGTDRYPPFSLAPHPTYPADLSVDRPERLSRGLVLVKWWLLAIPQYLVVVVLSGGFGFQLGVATALSIVAGVVLLVSRAYPAPLFDVVMGCERWSYRVLAYAALMTDEYPPFRFDGGGSDPGTPVPEPIPPPVPQAAEPERELVGTPR